MSVEIRVEDVKALWSEFASIPDNDVETQIEAAEREVAESFGEGEITDEERIYAVTRLAAHYLVILHGLAPASYSIAGISESLGTSANMFRENNVLSGSVFGQQYEKFCRARMRPHIARTG